MHRPRHDTWIALLLALAAPCLVPAQAAGESITFVNDTKAPLVVQLATAVRGGIRRDRPYQIAPGDKVVISLPGNKLVNIYDARLPNRVLYQGTLPASATDTTLSIKPDRPNVLGIPRVTLEVVPPPPPPAPPKSGP
jgi:hypothetical protein